MARGWAVLAVVVGSLSPVALSQGVAAAASSTTFSSAQIGTTGSTPTFTMTGSWTMSWSYTCAGIGSRGNFDVTVTQPAGDLTIDAGPNELGTGGSGTDHYYDSGTFHLSVISECSWSVSVAPSSAAPAGTPLTLSSSQVGATGSTQRFDTRAPWTTSWSYTCASLGSTGNFAITVVQPASDLTVDLGPDELGSSGSGTDTYHDSGTFNLLVFSECAWSITVNGTSAPPPPPPSGALDAPVVGMAATPDGQGYWLVTSKGQVQVHGDAKSYGTLPSQGVSVDDVVGVAPSESATGAVDGYWLDAADGGIFSFGTAHFYGSMGGRPLNQPMVSMAPTPDGRGYWTVAADGGIFSFGDAEFFGSMGGHPLNAPVVGMAVDPATGGYWLVASDGGIFSFNAPFYGSMGGHPLNAPIEEVEAAPTGGGYRFVAKDGGVFDFDLPFKGSLGGSPPADGIAAMAASGRTGYWLVESNGTVHDFGSAPRV